MEMLGSIGGDKHEFCLAIVKFKHEFCLAIATSKNICSCPSFDITYALLHRMNLLGYVIRTSRHM